MRKGFQYIDLKDPQITRPYMSCYVAKLVENETGLTLVENVFRLITRQNGIYFSSSRGLATRKSDGRNLAVIVTKGPDVDRLIFHYDGCYRRPLKEHGMELDRDYSLFFEDNDEEMSIINDFSLDFDEEE
jgi:hypothetical protein